MRRSLLELNFIKDNFRIQTQIKCLELHIWFLNGPFNLATQKLYCKLQLLIHKTHTNLLLKLQLIRLQVNHEVLQTL